MSPTPPLTVLSEEEQIFQQTVRDFARQELAPRVRKMDQQGHYDPEILPMLFDLGVVFDGTTHPSSLFFRIGPSGSAGVNAWTPCSHSGGTVNRCRSSMAGFILFHRINDSPAVHYEF